MGSTLEHGIYLPSEGEKNCYSGLANNWQTVDTNIGYVTALRQAIAGALTRQIVTQLPTEDIDTNCIYMILKATAQTSNIYDEYMYINSNWELIGDSQLDLSNYYTKQEVNQLPAVASGVTSTKVGNYDAHIANGDIHVTASDKAKWNTVALIKQLRLVNTQVGSATTIAFANIDDTNGIKVGDKCMDLDAKLFEITAVDATNETVTVGSALIDIALDPNVVHNSDAETVGGIKTFSDDTYIKSLNFTNQVASPSSSSSSILPVIATITYGDSSPSVQARLNLRVTADGAKSLYPHENNQYSLGLTSRKWSAVYGTAFYYGSNAVEFSQKFVTTDTNQNVAGIKNFTDDTYFKSLNFTNEVASTSSSGGATLPILSTVTYTDQTPSATARVNLSITAGGFKSLYPHENNVYSLGLNNRLWSDFYSYHGYFRGQQQNDEYSGNARTNLTLLANRDTLGTSGCLIDSFRENTTQGTGSHIIGFGIRENSVRYEGCRFSWLWDDNLGGYRFAFRPTLQGTNQAVEHDIGLSTDKWDKINGVEPSSLGMPDFDNAIDISGYVTVVANANKESLYTPPDNGWICVRLSRASGSFAVLLIQGGMASSGRDTTNESGVKTADAILPVVGGVQVSINSALADGVVSAKFIPCKGNV